MATEKAGSLKPETIDKYAKVLLEVAKPSVPFDIYKQLNEAGADFKLGGFLQKTNRIIKRADGLYNWIAEEGTEESIKAIICEFGQYRKTSDDRRATELKDLKYFQENREFLVDTRTMGQAAPLSMSNLPADLKLEIATAAATYAELAVKSGKKDIRGFVFHLFNLE